MKSPENNQLFENWETKLDTVCQILSKAEKTMCDITDNTLLFHSEFNEERQALDSEQKLTEFGLSPRRDGKKIFLIFQSSPEEIAALQKIYDFSFQEL